MAARSLRRILEPWSYPCQESKSPCRSFSPLFVWPVYVRDGAVAEDKCELRFIRCESNCLIEATRMQRASNTQLLTYCLKRKIIPTRVFVVTYGQVYTLFTGKICGRSIVREHFRWGRFWQIDGFPITFPVEAFILYLGEGHNLFVRSFIRVIPLSFLNQGIQNKSLAYMCTLLLDYRLRI